MPAIKRATEETSKPATKPLTKSVAKPAAAKAELPESKARPVATTRKPSKTALSPSEVTPLALLTPSKPARRRRSGAAKPRKLKGATTTWPFPTGSRP
ncbi:MULTISPECIES: hypothetical protein [unclassified Limnobacter]|uniref:Histone n=1 Tax=Limnobacter profundi TaxID=2732163 RepID=A0ABX6N8W5_9BURK|nr:MULTISPECIES: hypothetical protein [unclassified Limnobacter]QJR30488.1 hypothetical protein HKT17_12660 [Limnobacter sp. SAORIC-580]